MSVGAITKSNFEEFLKKIGKADEVKETSATNPIKPQNSFSAAVQLAKDTDVFTAEKQYGNTQTTEKEKSGSYAASMNGGNFVTRFLNIGMTNPVDNVPDASTNIGNLDAASSGHTPQGTTPITPSALRETSGNEATNPEQNKLTKEKNAKVDQFYQQFLEANKKAEDKADAGIKDKTGDVEVKPDNKKIENGKTDGTPKADKTPENASSQRTEVKDSSSNPNTAKTPNKNDGAKADNNAAINKQQETKQQQNIEQEKLKKAEEARKREED